MSTVEEAIDWAASFIERFENAEEPLFTLHGMEEPEDGSFQMPFYVRSPIVGEFVGGLDKKGLLVPFDWMAWSDTADSYIGNPESLLDASADVCFKLLTLHIRADRFTDGHLAQMLENGHITTILKRLREIRKSGQPIELPSNDQ